MPRARRCAASCGSTSARPPASARPTPCWWPRAQAAQGARVLAGIVETHGRRETAALLEGVATLPLKDVVYRGHTLKEFDLDGALDAHPDLVLVDELAHSNAPGSRHAKRWQDIQELLAAGIDVWTTLNVQHLDSLNEAVGSITGVRVWETVPDEVFDAADEVILVDLSADELLRRLKEGKVYLPEQARHATRNFFRKGNLIALRELALRRTADHVDDDVQAYRRDRAIEPVWRTREAVVACIGSDADADYVIRSAHRLSQQLECDLHVVTIDAPRAAPPPQAEQERLQRSLALADSLGARCETLAGGDMVDAVVRYVRRHNITKAIIGRTRASGLQRLRLSLSALLTAAISPGWLWRRHSFADMLAAGCPEIDIIRLGAPPLPASSAPGRDPLTLGRRGRQAADERGPLALAGYAWALCYCAVATALSALAFPALHQTNIVMLFLLAVVAVALRHGRGPAALASIVSVGLFDFFFVQPLASFAVSDVQYLLTFGVLLAVGLLIGQLTAGLRLRRRPRSSARPTRAACMNSRASCPRRCCPSRSSRPPAPSCTPPSARAARSTSWDWTIASSWPRPPPRTCRRWNRRWPSGSTTTASRPAPAPPRCPTATCCTCR